jgi:hypothetical protein
MKSVGDTVAVSLPRVRKTTACSSALTSLALLMATRCV